MLDAPATQPTAEQYEQLKERVDQLEARQAGTPAIPPLTFKTNTSNAGAGGNDVVSSLTGGWDGTRFTLASEDGNFTLHPGLVLDVRDMVTYRTDVPKKYPGEVAAAGYDTQNGFDPSCRKRWCRKR